MAKIDDGGSFHSHNEKYDARDHEGRTYVSVISSHPGISVRLWLAGMAMQAIYSQAPKGCTRTALAEDSLAVADALIAASKEPK